MLLNGPLAIAAAIGLAAVVSTSTALAYSHGKSTERGRSVKKLERLSNNYVALLINEKTEKFAEVGYERQSAREALETAEAALEAGDRSRRINREALAIKIGELEVAEAQSADLLNKLEVMRHDWTTRKVPNDVVCGIYDGVLVIPGCSGAGVAAASDDLDHSLELFRPDPPGLRGEDGAEG